MGSIVSLGSVTAHNEPVAEIIAILRDQLARAEAGELRALAFAYVDGGSFLCSSWHYGSAPGGLLVAAVARLQHRMLGQWDGAAVGPSPLPPAS